MTGKDKFDQIKEKLKAEKEANMVKKTEEVETVKEQIEQTREVVANNPELQRMMEEDAREEAKKLGGSMPILKVYVANKSNDLLANGEDPIDGYFYYGPTKQQYKDIHAHILNISRGFHTNAPIDPKTGEPRLDPKTGKPKFPYQHILSGVFLDEGEMLPFTMFVTGKERVNRLWPFRKELQDMGRTGTPTYSIVVTLTTEKIKLAEGQARVINFKINRLESGEIEKVSNMEDYLSLKRDVPRVEAVVEEWIQRKEVIVEKPKKLETAEPVEGVVEDGDTLRITDSQGKPVLPKPTETVNADDIPF